MPMVVYPHSISQHLPSSGSRGSFGPLFVVLAVVAVLTGIACLVGQICARRYLRPRHRRDHAPYQSDGDLETTGGIQMGASSASAAAAAAAHPGNTKGKMRPAEHMGKHGDAKQDGAKPPIVSCCNSVN